MSNPEYDIAVVGAGAAGLTAAMFAKRTAPDARVIALDGAPKIGAKILISGGGRCNVTHYAVTADDFNGNRNAIARVLRTFKVDETVEWLADLGVTLRREETGKLFPTTDRAKTIVDALLRGCEGVEIRTNARVQTIEQSPRGSPAPCALPPAPFLLDAISARRVILATGGRSVPKTGSDGHGYALARSLGHRVTDTFPALVPLVLEEGHWMTALSGTSAEVELSVRSETGRVLTRHRGSMLFTHFGISGPVVLDVSRHWIASHGPLFVNFLPGETFESLDVKLRATNPRTALGGRLPQRLLDELIPPTASRQPPTKEERRRLVRALLETPIPVVRDRGFDYAEVTAGGVPLSEVELSTMASRRCDGLYLCGEILDVDGRIGGFNFQWAWASGRLAGVHAARSLHS
ncbi:MAG: NAD(P)/FAD-dependent oxidoreductase [Thermoanaerobaculia bacterium]